MSETAFTPGEQQWTAKVDDYGYCYGRPFITVDDGFNTVCAVFTNTVTDKPVPNFADKAHLIAAAPDLYEALEASVTQMRVWVSINGDMIGALQEKIDAADAALAKARGEAP